MRDLTSPNLLEIIARVRNRWRMKLAMRGAARVAALALVLLLVAAYAMEWARFSAASIIAGRIAIPIALLAAVGWFIVRPLRRHVSDEQVALYLEEHDPSLQATLLSAVEASHAEHRSEASSALVARLVEQAVERCASMDAVRIERLPLRRWGAAFAAVALAAVLAVLVGPAFIRNAMSALLLVSRDVEAAAPYKIDVKPGNASVPKGADESITAKLLGFASEDVVVQAKRTPDGKFEALPLVRNDAGLYEGILFDVGAPVEYFVEAEGVRSPVYTLKVVDLPYVQRLDLEYHFPSYTGLEMQKVEDGGDIAALRGTEVRMKITPTMKTTGGRLVVNDKDSVPLTAQADGTLTASFTAAREGFYRVELEAPNGEKVAASPQYTIDVLDDQAPTVTFRKPGRDTSVSPIEEVFVEANAEDDYGVRDLELVYSVNGGAEKVVKMFDGSKRLPEVTAGHTFYLEELSVQPGDSVSYYARATDNDGVGGSKKATSDLFFLRIRPFKKDFRQAQSQGGGGGGGGGGGAAQVEALSEQQRQIISATFNVQRDRKGMTADKLRQNSTVVSLSQSRLREQVEGLLTRMNSQLVQRDPAFAKIGEMMPQAVAAMKEAEGKLSAAAPDAALAPEQKALQILQKAEEEYQLQVSVQQQQGGGGGGGGGAMQQELADIFEQELDKMASRYETASQASQQANDQQVDELLEKLKELARRQEQEAERQRRRALEGQTSGGGNSGAQQRALADQVEEAARRLEKLAREEQRQDLAESARQMREAADQMRRAAAGGDANAQAQAQAALERLRDTEKQLQRSLTQRAERNIEEAKQQAAEIAREQQQIADAAKQLGSGPGRAQQMRQLTERKDALEAKLGDLEQQLDRSARDASKDEKAASKKMAEAADALRDNRVRDTVRYTRSLVNRGATGQQLAAAENAISEGIEEARRKLDEAGSALGQGGVPGDKREEAVQRAERLARSLESLRERTREKAQGGKEAKGNGAKGDQNDQQARSQQGQGQQGQGQQGQGQQGQGKQGQGQQGQGQQGQGQQGQGQQGQGQGQQAQQGQGQGGQGQQNGQGQRNGQGGQFGNRDGSNQQAGNAYGGGYTGDDILNGGNAFGGNWQLSPEDIRQLRGEARQYSNDARELRGVLRGENLDPKQLDQIMEALRKLEDDRVYQDAKELQRLQAYVSEGLKRVEFSLRRQTEEGNAVVLSGSDEVPEQFRKLVEQYYRSLARTPR
jgi:hypothetical protein